jgi:hypothetical protein
LKVPKQGPLTKADALFQELKEAATSPTRETRARASWMSDSTWHLVDERAALHHSRNNDWAKARRLTHRIQQAIEADRKRHTDMAGTAIEELLRSGNPKRAWSRLKAWHKHARDCPSKPSRQDLQGKWTELGGSLLVPASSGGPSAGRNGPL